MEPTVLGRAELVSAPLDTQDSLHAVALDAEGRELGLRRARPPVRLLKSAGDEGGPSLRLLLSVPHPVGLGREGP